MYVGALVLSTDEGFMVITAIKAGCSESDSKVEHARDKMERERRQAHAQTDGIRAR